MATQWAYNPGPAHHSTHFTGAQWLAPGEASVSVGWSTDGCFPWLPGGSWPATAIGETAEGRGEREKENISSSWIQPCLRLAASLDVPVIRANEFPFFDSANFNWGSATSTGRILPNADTIHVSNLYSFPPLWISTLCSSQTAPYHSAPISALFCPSQLGIPSASHPR